MQSETKLVAALTRNRKAHEVRSAIGIDETDFSEAARALLYAYGEQYDRDPTISHADMEVLRQQLTRKYGKSGMVDSYMEYAEECANVNLSEVNIREEYRLARLNRVSMQIASLMAAGGTDERLDELLQTHRRLSTAGSDGEEALKLRLTAEDFDDENEWNSRIPLMPPDLNRFIGGGLLRGHNVTVFGRPDSGKSMFALNQSAFCIMTGLTVLYVANEEPERDITRRLLARMCDTDIANLSKGRDIQAALKKHEEAYDNWNLLHRAGCTAKDISRVAHRVKPDLIVVDQLRNLRSTGSGDNRALQLDHLARQVRELGIEHDALTMSVTQAGDSAHLKRVLQMNDVDFSNTGIPAAADLMIGIGVDNELMAQDRRMLSLPKNKVNGSHGSLSTYIDAPKTKFSSKRG
jgi:replicative DNA helicase